MIDYTPEDMRQSLATGVSDYERIHAIRQIAQVQAVSLEVERGVDGRTILVFDGVSFNTSLNAFDAIVWAMNYYFPGSRMISIEGTQRIWEYSGRQAGRDLR